jgi:Asp-tRNA(Asn)/Glu-tRNA(Gln) amidotransferase A subunit family amidase
MTEPSAARLAADLAAGKVKALEVTEACLARIAADEPRVQAFAHIDPEHARTQAKALDERKRAGRRWAQS